MQKNSIPRAHNRKHNLRKKQEETLVLTTAFLLAVFLFFPLAVFADTSSFNSSADSYVQSGSPNVNNGSVTVMDLNDTRDGVVRFDISAIPSGATVTSATLTLVATAVGSASSVKNYGAHRILADWVEGTVTWNTPGSTSGTHFASSPTQTIAVSTTGSYSWNVTSDVASFVAGSAVNYGWRVIWSSNTSGTSKQVDFGSKENITVSSRPVLSVTYNLPDTTAPGAVSDLALSSSSSNAMTVSWTASGDDASTGTATSYDLRYSASAITSGNFSSATPVTGEPVPSPAGSLESMSVGGLSPSTTYFFAIKVSDEVPNESGLSNVPSLATASGGSSEQGESGGGGSSGGVSPTNVIFSGQAYPGSKVEVLRKSIQDEIYRNVPTEFSTISDDGVFYISYTGLLGGDYLFGLRAEDKDGRKTRIVSFNADLLSRDKLIVENILIPPTFDFGNAVLSLGKEISMRGYSAPERKIEIKIDGILKGEAKSDKSGFWSFATSTATLRVGEHYARVRQADTASGRVSEFSVSRTFRVSLLASPRADLNGDSEVTIGDWSIFLFRWGSENKTLKAAIDMNDDGKVDISDLSIFLKTMQL